MKKQVVLFLLTMVSFHGHLFAGDDPQAKEIVTKAENNIHGLSFNLQGLNEFILQALRKVKP